uniref:Uncharacterized protein n=1 Tax=Salix viminalis TaxID=40686 RepID=A0A6N2M0V9_SALVM
MNDDYGRIFWPKTKTNSKVIHQTLNTNDVVLHVVMPCDAQIVCTQILQLETLRKQIAVHAAICEQLVEMHKTLSAQQDLAIIQSLIITFFLFSYILK